MCEINSHGGPIIVKRILELCVEAGARIAEPGEFTKLAFLNGRIDLAQAEAIIDMINSKTKKEQEILMDQLDGGLSEKINEIREEIMNVIVDVEATIDYPEYDIEEITREKIRNMLVNVIKKLKLLQNSFENGKIIKDGIRMAIIGKPNAGKSSLLNAILNEERAIVTDIEGTTRDTIEEYVVINGIPINVIDTAGIRNKTDDKIEEIGIKKAKKIAQNADLVIYITDVTKKIDNEELNIIEEIKAKKTIIVLNKMDLKSTDIKGIEKIKKYNVPIIEISALKKEGIDKIYKEISRIFNLGEIEIDNSLTVINERHNEIIINAIKNAEEGLKTIDENMPVDITTISVKNILEELGRIIGETVSEDIINEIFKKFCLGK